MRIRMAFPVCRGLFGQPLTARGGSPTGRVIGAVDFYHGLLSSSAVRCVAFWILALLQVVSLPAQPLEGSDKIPELLLESIEEILSDTNTPGAGLALVNRDRVEWAGGVGLAEIEDGRAVTSDTLFRIGSISTILVALSVLKLQEQGQLSIQRSVKSLAPELGVMNPWTDTHPLNLAHLLEHTGGLDDIHVYECAHNQADPIPLEEGLALNPRRTCRWPPGKHFSYSNAGIAMAAFIVAKVSGRSFESYVEDEWFRTLEMSTATYYPDENLATGYIDGQVAPYWHISLRPAGAVNASPREMANLLLLLLNEGRFGKAQLLSPESLQRMETSSTSLAALNGIRTGYGLCLDTTMLQGFLVRGHSGGIHGFLSRLEYLPQSGKGFVLFINSASPQALSRLTRLVRDHLLKGVPRSQAPPSEIPAWRVAGLAGYYRPIAPRQEIFRFLVNLFGVIRLDLQGNQLRLAGGDQGDVLIPVTDRRFRGPDDPIPTAAFMRDQGETILQGTGRVILGSYQALSFWRLCLERATAGLVLLLMVAGLLFSLYWCPLWFLGRLKDLNWMRLGVFPALSALALASCALIVLGVMKDPIQRLGNFTFWSGSLFALSWLFAVFAFLGAVQSIKGLTRVRTSLGVRVFALACSSAGLGIVVYLWSYGILGIRTWTY